MSFTADPIAEARAFREAMLKASGLAMTIEGLSDAELRAALYGNAEEFAARTGAKSGVTLSEAQRAALTEPLAWYETRIVDGRHVLVPVLYLPPSDALLRGTRGPGLIAADDLLIDVSGRLANTGALIATELASINAGELVNERRLNVDSLGRMDGAGSGAFGRSDTGLISAGELFVSTGGDLLNRAGTITAAGTVDLRVGGDLVNETLKVTRAVDFLDGCLGDACGTTRTDWAVAQIAAGADLTILAGGDLVNRGASIGAVTDALIAAEGGIRYKA